MSEFKEEHNSPPAGGECLCCFGDLDETCYVEYKASEMGAWLPSKFCEMCVQHLLSTLFKKYKDSLANSTCQAEMRRLVESGPPVNLKDTTALPCEEDSDNKNGEVHSLWYMSDGKVHSAQLEGALVGAEREAYWQEIKAFHDPSKPDEDKEKG